MMPWGFQNIAEGENLPDDWKQIYIKVDNSKPDLHQYARLSATQVGTLHLVMESYNFSNILMVLLITESRGQHTC
jgi:hypothetical protein